MIFKFLDADEPLGLVNHTFRAGSLRAAFSGSREVCSPLGELPPPDWKGRIASVRNRHLCFSLPGTISRVLTSEPGNESQTGR